MKDFILVNLPTIMFVIATALTVVLLIDYMETYQRTYQIILSMLQLLSMAGCVFAVNWDGLNINTQYQLEAEVYVSKGTKTVFTTDTGYYTLDSNNYYPEGQYLLTMDNMGTSEPKDDEILVVWETR